MRKNLKVGEPASKFEEYTGAELENKGWTIVNYDGDIGPGTECGDWLEEQVDDFDENVRWIWRLAVFFRKEEDAFAFKLRWI